MRVLALDTAFCAFKHGVSACLDFRASTAAPHSPPTHHSIAWPLLGAHRPSALLIGELKLVWKLLILIIKLLSGGRSFLCHGFTVEISINDLSAIFITQVFIFTEVL